MSWMEKLYQTYENCKDCIGNGDEQAPLLPVCHTTQNAQVQVTIDISGNFLRASVVPKSDAKTVIPATENSAGRTSKAVPHPLCDKLQYIAADYQRFGGDKDSCFDEYIKQLGAWCSSEFQHLKVQAVYTYLRKETLISDLVDARVLWTNKDAKLLQKWDGERTDTPQIFSVIQGEGGQSEAFIRFSVEIPGDPQADLWSDKSVWESWIDFYETLLIGRGLCYVTGDEMPLAVNHPAKIRNGGDKAKLISSNDTSGFTFRGRFTESKEACGIGFEVTQKAHNALRWLIARQGYRDDSQAIVAWAVSGAAIPGVLYSTDDLFSSNEYAIFPDSGSSNPTIQTGYTAQDIGIKLKKLIMGYSVKLGPTDKVVVMGLDSATPGRMAIRYYRELSGSEFLNRVLSWHSGCCWLQKFSKDKVFIGAPAPRDIAGAAYGRRLPDSLRRSTTERLLPCIIDGRPIPRDLVESCVRRASNRVGHEEHWEWEKALGIACALYRYLYIEKEYNMALERDRHTRDYLYGRLLALAEYLEGRALSMTGEQRETNAGKLMQRFADRPYSTWLTIETSLTPYKMRLRANNARGFLVRVEKELDEVMSNFTSDDFISDHRLTGEFLLGYHCQRSALWSKPNTECINIENDHEED